MRVLCFQQSVRREENTFFVPSYILYSNVYKYSFSPKRTTIQPPPPTDVPWCLSARLSGCVSFIALYTAIITRHKIPPPRTLAFVENICPSRRRSGGAIFAVRVCRVPCAVKMKTMKVARRGLARRTSQTKKGQQRNTCTYCSTVCSLLL